MKIEISNRSISWFFVTVVLAVFTYLLFVGYIIPGFKEIFERRFDTITIRNIVLAWVPIVNVLIISVMVCTSMSIFKKLKGYKQNGLILGLIVGFIAGLIMGLVGVLIGRTIGGLITGPSVGLVLGLIWGFTWELDV